MSTRAEWAPLHVPKHACLLMHPNVSSDFPFAPGNDAKSSFRLMWLDSLINTLYVLRDLAPPTATVYMLPLKYTALVVDCPARPSVVGSGGVDAGCTCPFAVSPDQLPSFGGLVPHVLPLSKSCNCRAGSTRGGEYYRLTRSCACCATVFQLDASLLEPAFI
jgi:hypothetical protein